ncbi:hypothetical protein PAT3040_04105 [Paenibacillus agaridevorans]|uniref:Uncharacterized protein n=1 Tax=Paenibacillus agaridevorans TaxID=171404 RepID=A0A2R5EUW6_9BACL|nr:hypothetical protein [Paenibacillus agaridevorans]GBG09459.1 hypothetical protein PAT3040_04105 [Paenibacillus agaridevorans]
MKMSVYYDRDFETGQLLPVWLLLENYTFDWDKPLFIPIESPFERFTVDQFDPDTLALSVPDNVYKRNNYAPKEIGLNMPALRLHAEKFIGLHYDASEIRKLLLRIGDIEDCLQYNLREIIT